MTMHQINSAHGQERSGGSARPGSVLGTWLGALTLAIAGILVFPGAIDDLSELEAPATLDDRGVSRLVAPAAESSRALQPSTGTVLRTSLPGERPGSVDSIDDADRIDASATAKPAAERLGRRMLRGVYEGLRQGWERLGRASIVVRDLTPEEGQRMPASFMPSRS